MLFYLFLDVNIISLSLHRNKLISQNQKLLGIKIISHYDANSQLCILHAG